MIYCKECEYCDYSLDADFVHGVYNLVTNRDGVSEYYFCNYKDNYTEVEYSKWLEDGIGYRVYLKKPSWINENNDCKWFKEKEKEKKKEEEEEEEHRLLTDDKIYYHNLKMEYPTTHFCTSLNGSPDSCAAGIEAKERCRKYGNCGSIE